MTEILGVPVAVLSGQLMLGVINGAFYALLSLGLAVICLLYTSPSPRD